MSSQHEDASGYLHTAPNRSAAYVFEPIKNALSMSGARRVFEIGCGTGDIASRLALHGFDILATDPSPDAIRQAVTKYSATHFELASSYDDLPSRFGRWDAVLAVEVVEHLYSPKAFAACAYSLLENGGVFVLTTPFHGYWKNLALSLFGQWDSHHMPLKDHGHIKFWSEHTIRGLLISAGFDVVKIERVGRIPMFAKSMVVTALKPSR